MGREKCQKVPLALIFLGPPGSGKGTQARRLAHRLCVPQISTGDFLRDAVENRTPLGLAANPHMEAGELVPDEIVCGLVEERIQAPDCIQGFILDGFPRTLAQAQRIDQVLQVGNSTSIRVMNLQVSEAILVKWVTGRRTCSICGEIYNIYFNPSRREGICDRDGGDLRQRSDDTVETSQERQRTYKEQTQPLIDHYRRKNLLFDIDGNQDSARVTENLHCLLKTSGFIAGCTTKLKKRGVATEWLAEE